MVNDFANCTTTADYASGFDEIVVWDIGCELLDDKFLKEIANGSCAKPDGRVYECQFRAVAILRWIVDI